MAGMRTVRLAGRETAKKRTRRSEGRVLDQKQDFEQPTRTPEQTSDPNLQAQTQEAPNQETVPRIVKGFMAVAYVKPHFEVDKDVRTCALEFSLELTTDHIDHLPKRVADAYEVILDSGYKKLELIKVPAQHFDARLAVDDKESDLALDAPVEKVVLSVVEDTGTGDAKDIVRLQFRLVCELTQTVERFACRNFGNTIWLKLEKVQGEIFE